uniref:SAM domain-containing protein n=1 Tax=Salix viminalis TaxID=40686 RepID=A0A6N2NHJ4_SALVM
MEEIHPPETHLNNGGGGGSSGGGGALTSSETVGPKRQRRPSVRLGEIGGGDQLYEPQHHRRTASTSNKQWKQQQQSLGSKEASKSSKTRALTNLSEFNEILDGDNDINLDSVAIGSWRVNHSSKKRGSLNVSAKRVRSNWVSKFDDSSGGGGNGGEGEEKYSGGEDLEEEEGEEEEEEEEDCREFGVENSESLLKEQSRIHDPLDNLGGGNERNGREVHCNRRLIRGRNDRNVNHDYRHDGDDLSGPSDNDTRDYRNNGRCGGGGEDGVRIWLNSLGLGRYAPVFEIHEVDDEVLAMLTLEDLKDMGINAVGSRRKMFCAIQKLGKGFS